MARPSKPAITPVEHEILHAAGGLRTGARAISRIRGAYAASASAQERKNREVSWQWVKRQHATLGCDKTMGATKPHNDSKTDDLRQNSEAPVDTVPRMVRPDSPEPSDRTAIASDSFVGLVKEPEPAQGAVVDSAGGS